ncbi:MAG: glycosyltransferase [Saprospiraceae bacterium]|nr:glycosyltransferase [Saprospiraceae bacterium]
MKYLILGPQYKKAKTEIGGTTVSFDLLCEYARSFGKEISVIRTNKFSKKYFNYLNYIWILFFSAIRIPRCKIVLLNVSPSGMYFLSPVLFLYSKLWSKKFVIRVFGGNEEKIYSSGNIIKNIIFEKIIRNADLLLLQTKNLVENFKKRVKNVSWLPTSRKIPSDIRSRSAYRKKLVFVSQIHEAKGIKLILELKTILPEEYVLDVYGPILEEKYQNLISEPFYKGVFDPQNVFEVLKGYDILLLPTRHLGEGYPGIIIEALCSAVPVICSKWLSLPELIVHEQNGFLISSRMADDWLQLIQKIDEPAYLMLSENALKSGAEFDGSKVNRELFQKLDAICTV